MSRRNGRRYQQVCTSIWDDEKFKAMDDDARQVFLYLLTTKHSNLTGLFIMPVAYIVNDLAWKPLAKGSETPGQGFLIGYKRVMKSLDLLQKMGRIGYDEATETVLMVNHLKHRPLDNDNKVTGAMAAIGEIPQSHLFSRLLSIIIELKEPKLEPLAKALETLAQPLANPWPTLGHTVTVTVPVTVPVTVVSPDDRRKDPAVRRLGELLFSLIRQRDNKAKNPNWDNWDAHIDKLMRIDGRAPDEVEAVIRWSQDDDFWQKNILSAETLRRQFQKLWMKAKGGNHGIPGGKSGEPRNGWTGRENADQVRGLKPSAVIQSGGEPKPE